MTQTDQQNVPKLRFPGFEGAWEYTTVQTLVDQNIIAKPMDGNHGNIHPVASDFVDEGIPFIMANDLREGKICFERARKISKSQADSLQKGFALAGDILLTHKATLGETAVVPEVPWDYIMLTPQVTYYRVTDPKNYDPRFLYQYFATSRFQSELENKAGGATRLYIGITEQRKLGLPKCEVAEQRKISSFLGALDTKIAHLAKKRQLLENYKKGCMQQLFFQAIRFKDEDGKDFPDWEERQLGEVARKTASAISANSLEASPGDYPVYGASGIAGYVDYFSSDESHIGVVKDGAGVGRLYYCPPQSSVLGTLESVTASNQNNTKFIYYWMSQINFSAYSTGSTIPHVYFKDYGKKKGLFPHPNEQQKIADFLSALDHKIALLSDELAHAQTFKKGLLQQMFV